MLELYVAMCLTPAMQSGSCPDDKVHVSACLHSVFLCSPARPAA